MENQETNVNDGFNIDTATMVAREVDWIWKNFLFVFGFAAIGEMFGLFKDKEDRPTNYSILTILASIAFSIKHVIVWAKLREATAGTVLGEQLRNAHLVAWVSVVLFFGAFPYLWFGYDYVKSFMKYKHFELSFIIALLIAILLQIYNFVQTHAIREWLKSDLKDRGYKWKEIISK